MLATRGFRLRAPWLRADLEACPTARVLGDLVDSYVTASGDVAAFLIARRIENVPHGELDLPENLAAHL